MSLFIYILICILIACLGYLFSSYHRKKDITEMIDGIPSIKYGQKTAPLTQDQYMFYNGIKIHWFIGDFNNYTKKWEVWGSTKRHAYQLSAWMERGERKLIDIRVTGIDLNGDKSPYYHEETYKSLTAIKVKK